MDIKADDNQYEVRVLNLKKWNLPQRTPLREFSLYSDSSVHRFVSCQSYHFAEVSAPKKNPGIIHSAYDEIVKKIRKPDSTSVVEVSEIHTVQSVVMLGKKNNFWETDSSHLNITFIQLTNSKLWDFDSLENGIREIIDEHKKETKNSALEWCMYYSLDFCDLILFTKNVSFNAYHDILWALVPYREKGLHQIRDTFTMLCFGYNYIIDAFAAIDAGNEPVWNDEVGLALRMSVQSKSSVVRVQDYMKQFGSHIQQYRIPGRYDMMYVSPKLKGSDVLRILHFLDEQSKGKENEVLAGYDITFLVDPLVAADEDVDAPLNHNLLKSASQMLDLMCKEYCSSDTLHANYAVETSKALQGLLKRGFSDEFVVSVLPSFIAYLNTCISIDAKSDNKEVKTIRLNYLKYRYFGAVNTLSLCTMHTERQFVQAPAYNATYFDVPPKMLALYSAIANEISKAMEENDKRKYRFIIIPDYRKDIYVKALTTHKSIADIVPEHLAVVYLNEQYFYDPVKAVKLLAHEIGHYVGDRKRIQRSESLFCSISLHILSQTPLCNLIPASIDFLCEDSLIVLLANSLGDYMFHAYENWSKGHGELTHRIDDVTEFLFKCQWGYSFFEKKQSEAIHAQWHAALSSALQTGKGIKKDYLRALDNIENTLQTNYFSEHCKETSETVSMVVRTIIRQVQMIPYVIRAEKKNDATVDGVSAFSTLGQNVVQAYREAFADLRMIEISGISKEEYVELLDDVCRENTIERALRKDAICMTMYKQTGVSEAEYRFNEGKTDQNEIAVMATIARYIKSYLEGCRRDLSEKSVEGIIQIFSTQNAVEQAKFIHRKIYEYKRSVCKMCQDMYEDKVENEPSKCRETTCDVCDDTCDRNRAERAMAVTG